MDRKRKKRRFFGGLFELIKGEVSIRKNDGVTLLYDIGVVLIAFIFARCHVVFGAYPLHIAFLAVLPSGVWLSLISAVIGSLSLGELGIVNAVCAVVTVFLRTLISSPHASEEEPFLFREPLLLRISSAVISSFVGGLYVALGSGFSFSSVIYLGASVLLSAAFSFVFFGVFDGGITLRECLFGTEGIFAKKRTGSEKYSFVMAIGSFLFYVFFVSRALGGYEFLGISPAYMIASALTLFFAKRFGPLAAITVGFVATFSLSPIYAVGFALLGLAAGVFTGLGLLYSSIVGGVALSLWAIYVGGVMGFLSVFPEYAATALIITPFLRRIKEEKKEKEEPIEEKAPLDMVNTTALSYIKRREPTADRLCRSVSGIARAIEEYCKREKSLSLMEYRDCLIGTVSGFCKSCPCFSECSSENPAPCAENIDEIATNVYKNKGFFASGDSALPEYCKNRDALLGHIKSALLGLLGVGYVEECGLSFQYELLSRIIAEAGYFDECEACVNKELSERVAAIAADFGMCFAEARVLGERRLHFILAGEDKDGSIITSADLHKKISEAAGVSLSTPEYYRRGNIALVETGASASLSWEYATLGECGGKEESGDRASFFESEGYLYSLISDGMGSGKEAGAVSLFVCEFLSSALSSGATKPAIFHLLNHLIRTSHEESSATVDLFELDTVTGEACFYKCGAADSYIKRGDSIFRIRSETAPIGLMKSIDAEKIRVKVEPSDLVIMISDGVSEPSADSAELLEALHRADSSDLHQYAQAIINCAKKSRETCDDMTVSVMRISARS